MSKSFAVSFALACAALSLPLPALAATGSAAPKYASYYYQSEPSATPYSAQTSTYSYGQNAPVSAPAEPTSGWNSRSDWDISVGIGVFVFPKYPGADTHQVLPLPTFSVVYRKDYFLNERGLGANLGTWGDWKAGILLGWEFGRDHKDAALLNPLSDIAPSLNAGGYVSYQMGAVELRTTLRHAITHASSYGTSGDFSATYRGSILPGTLDFSAGPQVSFADTDYMQTWFGVPAARATGGLRAYDAGWGVKDVGLKGSVTYHVTPQVNVSTFLGVKELVGDASDSPLSKEDTQVSGGLGVSYKF